MILHDINEISWLPLGGGMQPDICLVQNDAMISVTYIMTDDDNSI